MEKKTMIKIGRDLNQNKIIGYEIGYNKALEDASSLFKNRQRLHQDIKIREKIIYIIKTLKKKS